MDETIVVNKFDLNSMVKNPTILLNAKRGSGKSVCIKHLLWYFGSILHYPVGVLCSKSEAVDPFYQKFFPRDHVIGKPMTPRAAAVTRTMRIKSEFPSAIPAAEYDRYHF